MELPFLRFPQITEEDKKEARANQSYIKLAFDYFKITAVATLDFASIDANSPAWNKTSKLETNVIRGNLIRIAHLAMSVVELSHDGDSRETVCILNRSITESAVKLRWCLNTDQKERLKLFVHSGVQADLQLRNKILKNISENNEKMLIEARMLRSLDRLARNSGFLWDEVSPKAKLPKFDKMLEDIGLSELYLVMQKFPSQSVHGAWSDLVMNYLYEKNGELYPRDKTLEVPDVMFLFPAMIILETLTACSRYCISDINVQKAFLNYFEEARDNTLWMIKDSATDEFISAK